MKVQEILKEQSKWKLFFCLEKGKSINFNLKSEYKLKLN